MIVEALIERLDQPNHNGHIYTTKCIDDAIINNKVVQERLHNNTEFVIDGTKSDNAKNVLAYLDSGDYSAQDIVGRVLNYYIKDNCLYATVDIKDDVFTEKDKLYMGGIGTIDTDGVVNDYEFGILYRYKVDKEKEERRMILKPCPHCGCSNRLIAIHILSARLPWWYYIECDNCHWCGKTKLFLWRAERAWNKEKKK